MVCITIIGQGIQSTAVAARGDNARFRFALKYFNQGEYSLAYDLFGKLLRRNPRNALYWFNYANCLYKLERYQSAANAYEKVIIIGSPLEMPAQL